MAAPEGNQFAKGNNGGNPGYGKLNAIRERVEKYSAKWWEKWEVMIDSDDKQERIEAMREFNKLQCKMIPQQIGSDPDNPIAILANVCSHNCHKESNGNEGADTSAPGGDGSVQNSIDNLIPDSPGADR